MNPVDWQDLAFELRDDVLYDFSAAWARILFFRALFGLIIYVKHNTIRQIWSGFGKDSLLTLAVRFALAGLFNPILIEPEMF